MLDALTETLAGPALSHQALAARGAARHVLGRARDRNDAAGATPVRRTPRNATIAGRRTLRGKVIASHLVHRVEEGLAKLPRGQRLRARQHLGLHLRGAVLLKARRACIERTRLEQRIIGRGVLLFTVTHTSRQCLPPSLHSLEEVRP